MIEPGMNIGVTGILARAILASQLKPDPNSPANLRIAELRAKWEVIALDIEPIPWVYSETDARVFPTLLGFAVNFNISFSFPLNAAGRLDSSQPELITATCTKMLFHGVRVGSPLGERYFQTFAEARAFLVEPATEFEALAAILRIDAINLGLLPKGSLQADADAPESEPRKGASPRVKRVSGGKHKKAEAEKVSGAISTNDGKSL